MNYIIYYFSSTGNTLDCVQQLQKLLPQSELRGIPFAVKQAQKISIPLDSKLILAFPLYYLSYPPIVKDFLELLECKTNTSAYALVTRGMKHMGGLWTDLKKDLNKNNLTLKTGIYVEAPNNDIILFNGCPTHKIKAKLNTIPQAIHKFSLQIQSAKNYFTPEPFALLKTPRIAAYQKKLPHSHTHFFANNLCTGCGLCVRLCPLDRITLSNNTPQWHPGCQECQACINYCPTKAINYGKVTQKKRRYQHPCIKPNQIEKQKNS